MVERGDKHQARRRESHEARRARTRTRAQPAEQNRDDACQVGPLLILLRRGAARGARQLAIGAVVAIVWAWGIARHPYLLPTQLTIDHAAAPGPTLTGRLIVFGVAVLLVLLSIGLLFTLAQWALIEEGERPQQRHGGAPT